MTDSSTGGFLAPIGPQQPDDADLDLLIQPIIVGVSGLDGTFVRRKGQAIPGQQPDRNATWCAFAFTATESDTNPTILHDGAADGGEGLSYELRSEALDITASFYGPAAVGTAKLLRDGLGISQNRENMRAMGLAYVGMERITFVPDSQNGQFIRRADVVFRARRMAVRTYAIRNILSVEGALAVDSGSPNGPAVVLSPFETET